MWSRQLHRICAPLLQNIAANTTTVISYQPGTIASVWQRSYHLLANSMLTRRQDIAIGADAQRIVTPIAAHAPAVTAICGGCATPQLQQTAGFKLKRVLKRRCKDCYFVVRENRLHVICQTHPRHKQMAITKPTKSTWILTHATQSPVRPW